ncbi:tRNA ligase subunit PheS family protein, partial [Oribacterium sinus]|uniref:tRNA ligase subunit PheS family protein n=1 Tax=Oribacterium sinus TaxID=237576 RepID=UPI003FA565B8
MDHQVLQEIVKRAEEQIAGSRDLTALNDIRVQFLGKKGELTEAKKLLKDLSPEERPKFGQLVNEMFQKVEQSIKSHGEALERSLREAKMQEETIDITLPAKKVRYGHPHPNTLALEEVEKIFIGMGFEVVEGPEVEYD